MDLSMESALEGRGRAQANFAFHSGFLHLRLYFPSALYNVGDFHLSSFNLFSTSIQEPSSLFPTFFRPRDSLFYYPKSLYFSPTCLITFALWVLFSGYSFFSLYPLFLYFLFSLVKCHTKMSFSRQNGPYRSDDCVGCTHINVIRNQKIWPCWVFLSHCCGSDFGSQLSKSCKHLLFSARLLF